MVVSQNRGTPKSSILIRSSVINYLFLGTLMYGSIHIPQSSTDQEGLLKMSREMDEKVPLGLGDPTRWRMIKNGGSMAGFMAGLVGVSSTLSGNSPGFFMRRKHLRRCKWGILGHSNLMKFNEIQWNFHGVLCAFEKFVGVWFCTSLNEYPSIDWSS